MSKFRCRTCRNYFPNPPYRRDNLGGVCSKSCADGAYAKADATRQATAAERDEISDEVTAQLHVRDRSRCRWCGTGMPGLHRHHIRYRSEGVDHSITNLILLCDEHHSLVHSNKKLYQPACLAYIWAVTVDNRRPMLPALVRLLKEEADAGTEA